MSKMKLIISTSDTKTFDTIHYIDLDFANVDVDGSVVLPETSNNKEVLKQLKVLKLSLVVVAQTGPAGGASKVRLFGSKNSILKYLMLYGNPEDYATDIQRLLK